jgi:hypothetical protein
MGRLLLAAFALLQLSFLVVAQTPPIGTIDLFGLRSVTVQQVRAALHAKEGDAPPSSKQMVDEIVARLNAIPKVEEATVDFLCCGESGKTILYVGIREKGTPALKFRNAPNGNARLPAETVKLGSDFYEALEKAVLKGEAAEDDSAGHSVLNNAEARAVQEQFIGIAAANGEVLRKVIRESSDVQHRALAVQIIAYSPDKRKIVNDLVYALKDADSTVRNNAMRALWVLALYAQKNTAKKIDVPVEPFVDLLNSVVWTDRNKSSLALFALTGGRDPKLLKTLRKKALPSLLEMARWKSQGHAFAPLIILGRIAGIPDGEIFEAMQSGKKDKIIKRVEQELSTKP